MDAGEIPCNHVPLVSADNPHLYASGAHRLPRVVRDLAELTTTTSSSSEPRFLACSCLVQTTCPDRVARGVAPWSSANTIFSKAKPSTSIACDADLARTQIRALIVRERFTARKQLRHNVFAFNRSSRSRHNVDTNDKSNVSAPHFRPTLNAFVRSAPANGLSKCASSAFAQSS